MDNSKINQQEYTEIISYPKTAQRAKEKDGDRKTLVENDNTIVETTGKSANKDKSSRLTRRYSDFDVNHLKRISDIQPALIMAMENMSDDNNLNTCSKDDVTKHLPEHQPLGEKLSDPFFNNDDDCLTNKNVFSINTEFGYDAFYIRPPSQTLSRTTKKSMKTPSSFHNTTVTNNRNSYFYYNDKEQQLNGENNREKWKLFWGFPFCF